LIEWRGLAFEPDDVALTPGAFGALAVALDVLVDPGDEVIFSLPPWFLYEGLILGAGAVPVKVPTRAEDYDLDLDAIAGAISPQTRALIVNTPNNPTGRIYPASTLKALADLLSERSSPRDIYLISDEPYARLVFSDASFVSPSAFYDRTLISYSYGKVHLTPGQRLGWLAVNPSMPNREEMQGLIEMAQVAGGWIFPNAVMQRAIEDLENLSIDLVELERKRDLMVDELTRIGYSVRKPEGTFYLWVHSPDPDDFAFCNRLADDGVMVLPGTVCEGPGHFRISLTASRGMLEDSLPVFKKARDALQ
jgi:aspartate aminotransferase